jgi:imidazolonepropionase
MVTITYSFHLAHQGFGVWGLGFGVLATDSNPGSSPLTSPLLAMNMGCTLFRMTPQEALAGFTINAARALGLAAEIGSLEPGKRAEIAIWDIADPAELSYRIGFNPLYRRIAGDDF